MKLLGKSIKLRQIVKQEKVARKWRKLASVRKAVQALAVKFLCLRLCRVCYVSDDTHIDVVGVKESSNGHRRSLSAILPDVPLGHLPVYVGQHCDSRFVIRAAYLNHPVFRALLDKAEEEFGHAYRGGLAIPCDELLFDHILRLFSRNGLAAVRHLDLEAVKSNFCNEWNCSSEVNGILLGNGSSPLLQPFAQRSIG